MAVITHQIGNIDIPKLKAEIENIFDLTTNPPTKAVKVLSISTTDSSTTVEAVRTNGADLDAALIQQIEGYINAQQYQDRPTRRVLVQDLPRTEDAVDAANAKHVTQHVAKEVAKLVNGAPEWLDTLKELADALGNEQNYPLTKSILKQIADEHTKNEEQDQRLDNNERDIDNLATVAKTGKYRDLVDVNPYLPNYAGPKYEDLPDKPFIPLNVDDLLDVTATNPEVGQFLAYDETGWKSTNTIRTTNPNLTPLTIIAAPNQTENVLVSIQEFDSGSQTSNPTVIIFRDYGAYPTAFFSRSIAIGSLSSQGASVNLTTSSGQSSITITSNPQVNQLARSVETNVSINTGGDSEADIFTLAIPDNTTMNFEVNIIGIFAQTDSNSLSIAKGVSGKLKFTVYRNASGSATLAEDFGGQIKEIESYGLPGYDFYAKVGTSDALRIVVVGGTGEFVKWVANVRYLTLSRV